MSTDKDKYYNLFEKYFNINLKNMSKKEANNLIDKINDDLDNKILEQKRRKKHLLDCYQDTIKRVISLKEQV